MEDRGLPVPVILADGSSTVNDNSYSTGSLLPAANKPLYAAVLSSRTGGSINTPTCIGNGLTWTLVSTGTVNVDGTRRLAVFEAIGETPVDGPVTFDYDGQDQASVVFAVLQIDEAAVDAFSVQVRSGSPITLVRGKLTSLNVNTYTNTFLNDLEHENNIHLAFIATEDDSGEITPDPDFVEVSDRNITHNDARLEIEWARNQKSCSPSWNSGDQVRIISVEVKSLVVV